MVRFDDLRVSSTDDPAQMALVEELIKAGYPITEAIVPAPSGRYLSAENKIEAYLHRMIQYPRYDASTHGWKHLRSELEGNSVEKDLDLVRYGTAEIFHATDRMPAAYIPPNNAYDENALIALSEIGTTIISAEKGDFRWFAGLDERGLLHASNTLMFEQGWTSDIPYFETDQVLDFFGSLNDAVFSIHPSTATTPERKQRIRDTLDTLSRQRGTQLVNFDEFCRANPRRRCQMRT